MEYKGQLLKNAPITEALIDLRVNLPEDFDVEKFLSLKEKLSSYPDVKPRAFFEAVIDFVDKPEHQATTHNPIHKVDGYFFQSTDKKKVVQFRKDGFTFSQLKPYTQWSDLLNNTKDLWSVYVSEYGSIARDVTRIAVRYINHIKIPLPIGDFKEYFTVPPDVPKEVPQAVRGFFSRVSVYDDKQKLNANITQALQSLTDPDFVNIILDIDVFKIGSFGVNSSDIWEVTEQLCALKNKIFYGSITERTERLFE